MNGAAVRQQALARAAAGDDAGAARLFAEGLAAFPSDARLANSAGSYHAGAGRPEEALALFDRALALMPDLAEARINRAVVLPRLGRAGEAAAALKAGEATLANAPRYWTTRAAAEIAAGDFTAAAISYDAALRREPGNARAMHGRARTALELGESRALADHERALTANPGQPDLLFGYAHALQAAGRLNDALVVSEAMATQWPGWVDGMELHAGLRWATGDRDRFDRHYANAAHAWTDPALYRSWAAMLSGVDRHTMAADVLATARARWPEDTSLAQMEAVAAGEAGDLVRAETLFTRFARPDPAWRIAEARHRLRLRDPGAAEILLAHALTDAPDDVAGWSLRDLTWRLLGDPRHDWLHGQKGLVRVIALDLSAAEIAAARVRLDTLHDRSAMPIGQSVKHGSQTRGALFRRADPEIARMAAAIDRALSQYRAGLPGPDASHPLLRHRDTGWMIAGSWSIRLDGAGHHAAHIHPHGILSSAAYLTVPSQVAEPDAPGCLELGRPPAELALDLEPVATIVPQEGHCVLFPSTLYHGTRPITTGRRLTTAFDVATATRR